jgi:hypothetical protein
MAIPGGIYERFNQLSKPSIPVVINTNARIPIPLKKPTFVGPPAAGLT